MSFRGALSDLASGHHLRPVEVSEKFKQIDMEGVIDRLLFHFGAVLAVVVALGGRPFPRDAAGLPGQISAARPMTSTHGVRNQESRGEFRQSINCFWRISWRLTQAIQAGSAIACSSIHLR
jgi:hypothetical protein